MWVATISVLRGFHHVQQMRIEQDVTIRFLRTHQIGTQLKGYHTAAFHSGLFLSCAKCNNHVCTCILPEAEWNNSDCFSAVIDFFMIWHHDCGMEEGNLLRGAVADGWVGACNSPPPQPLQPPHESATRCLSPSLENRKGWHLNAYLIVPLGP